MLSLQQLNTKPATTVQLQMLRCLCTSDLAFHYMLLSPTTCADIARTARSLLSLDEKSTLSKFGVEEYEGYCAQLEEYAANANPVELALTAMQALTHNQFAVFDNCQNTPSEDIQICTALTNSFERIAPTEGTIATTYSDQLHQLRMLAVVAKG